jgi:hypothetical protein
MCWHSTKIVFWGSFERFHVTFSFHLLIIWMKDCIIYSPCWDIGNYLSPVNFISSKTNNYKEII